MTTTMAPTERKGMEYKLCFGEIKEMNDANYQFGGHISVKNNLDYGRDIVRNGAYRKTLADAFQRKAAGDPFLYNYLWNHDSSQIPPGGIYDADEDKHGMYAWVQLNPEVQLARELYASLKMKTLRKQSVGYIAPSVNWIKGEDGKGQVREILEMDVKEGSCVVFAMNDLARIDQVKRYWPGYSAGKGGSTLLRSKTFDTRYAAETLDDWLFSDFSDITSALRSAIQDCFTEGGDPLSNLENDVLPQLASALRAYVQEGVSLGYEPSSMQDSYAMMSLAGKSGYLAAEHHTAIASATQNIMKSAKGIQKALSSLENRQRSAALAGNPRFMSSSSIFEEKEDEEEASGYLRLAGHVIDARKLVEELHSLPIGQVNGLLDNLRRANNTLALKHDGDELTRTDRLRLEKMNSGL